MKKGIPGERRLPLELRLPNPPPVFVGRADEAARLGALMERAPLSLVCGPPGIGKTALALHALRERGGAGGEVVFIDTSRAGEEAAARATILRALSAAAGAAPPQWHEAEAREVPDALLIDLAESGGWTVVVDGLGCLWDEALLSALLAYGHRSRWLITARQAPRAPALAAQTLSLGPMGGGELAELARAWVPLDLAEAVTAARQARGSPRLLQEEVLGRAGRDGHRRLFQGLPPGTLRFLEALALLEVAVPLHQLAPLLPPPSAGELDALEARGLVIWRRGGVQLSPGVAAWLRGREGEPPPLRPVELGTALAASPDPHVCLEGLRLLLMGGQVEAAAEVLGRVDDRLIDGGCAPALQRLLIQHPHPRLEWWRLMSALAVGDPDVCASLSAEAQEDPRLLTMLARLRLIRGEDVLGVALEARDKALEQGDGVGAFEAGRVALAYLIGNFQLTRAQAMVATLEPPSAVARTSLDAWEGVLLALLGLPDERLDVRLRLVPSSNLDPWERQGLAHVQGLLARLRDLPRLAYERCSQALEEGSTGPLRLPLVSQLCHACLTLGRMEEVGVLLERLRPLLPVSGGAQSAGHFAPMIHHLFETGRCDEARALCIRARGTVRGDAGRSLEHLGQSLDDAFGRLETPLPPWEPPGADQDVVDVGLAYQRLRSHALRGEVPALDVGALRAAAPDQPNERCLLELALTTCALVEGDWEAAQASLGAAVELSSARELRLIEMDARQLRIDLLLAMGQLAQALEEADRVARQAGALGMLRAAAEADFIPCLFLEGAARGQALSRWSGASQLAPAACRRALWLLGHEPSLTAVDRRALAGPWGRRGRCLEGGEVAGLQAWGLAGPPYEVWRADGAVISLGTRPQLGRILDVLFEAGGEASKEALVREVWGVTDYHPLRDDNRLHSSVRKLRRAIEGEAPEATYVVTTQEGYRLASGAHRITLG